MKDLTLATRVSSIDLVTIANYLKQNNIKLNRCSIIGKSIEIFARSIEEQFNLSRVESHEKAVEILEGLGLKLKKGVNIKDQSQTKNVKISNNFNQPALSDSILDEFFKNRKEQK